MLEQNVIVLRTEGDKAWVEARESGACGSCGSNGCSTRRLADLFGRRDHVFPVDNVLEAKPGDYVIIGIPAGALWKSAFRLYGLPLLLMFTGAFAGQHMDGDPGAVALAVLGLLAAFWAQKIWRASHAQQPVMLRRGGGHAGLVIKSC